MDINELVALFQKWCEKNKPGMYMLGFAETGVWNIENVLYDTYEKFRNTAELIEFLQQNTKDA